MKIDIKTLKIYIKQNFYSLHSFNLNTKMLNSSAQPTTASPDVVSYWRLEELENNIEDFSACLSKQMRFSALGLV